MANYEDVLWARHGQLIVARVISSWTAKRRSFEGYHDQLLCFLCFISLFYIRVYIPVQHLCNDLCVQR